MGKYSNKQLHELAAGSFKCSPNEKAFYASENGTFLNETQYNKLTDKEKEAYLKIENPKLKAPLDIKKIAKEAAKKTDEKLGLTESEDEEDEEDEVEGEEADEPIMKVPAGPKVPKKGEAAPAKGKKEADPKEGAKK